MHQAITRCIQIVDSGMLEGGDVLACNVNEAMPSKNIKPSRIRHQLWFVVLVQRLAQSRIFGRQKQIDFLYQLCVQLKNVRTTTTTWLYNYYAHTNMHGRCCSRGLCDFMGKHGVPLLLCSVVWCRRRHRRVQHETLWRAVDDHGNHDGYNLCNVWVSGWTRVCVCIDQAKPLALHSKRLQTAPQHVRLPKRCSNITTTITVLVRTANSSP